MGEGEITRNNSYVSMITISPEQLDFLQETSCKLDFQQTMTFIFAAFTFFYMISRVVYFIRENRKNGKRKK